MILPESNNASPSNRHVSSSITSEHSKVPQDGTTRQRLDHQNLQEDEINPTKPMMDMDSQSNDKTMTVALDSEVPIVIRNYDRSNPSADDGNFTATENEMLESKCPSGIPRQDETAVYEQKEGLRNTADDGPDSTGIRTRISVGENIGEDQLADKSGVDGPNGNGKHEENATKALGEISEEERERQTDHTTKNVFREQQALTAGDGKQERHMREDDARKRRDLLQQAAMTKRQKYESDCEDNVRANRPFTKKLTEANTTLGDIESDVAIPRGEKRIIVPYQRMNPSRDNLSRQSSEFDNESFFNGVCQRLATIYGVDSDIDRKNPAHGGHEERTVSNEKSGDATQEEHRDQAQKSIVDDAGDIPQEAAPEHATTQARTGKPDPSMKTNNSLGNVIVTDERGSETSSEGVRKRSNLLLTIDDVHQEFEKVRVDPTVRIFKYMKQQEPRNTLRTRAKKEPMEPCLDKGKNLAKQLQHCESGDTCSIAQDGNKVKDRVQSVELKLACDAASVKNNTEGESDVRSKVEDANGNGEELENKRGQAVLTVGFASKSNRGVDGCSNVHGENESLLDIFTESETLDRSGKEARTFPMGKQRPVSSPDTEIFFQRVKQGFAKVVEEFSQNSWKSVLKYMRSRRHLHLVFPNPQFGVLEPQHVEFHSHVLDEIIEEWTTSAKHIVSTFTEEEYKNFTRIFVRLLKEDVTKFSLMLTKLHTRNIDNRIQQESHRRLTYYPPGNLQNE